jgi:ABC-type Fe3+ transport system substrate-binding protein
MVAASGRTAAMIHTKSSLALAALFVLGVANAGAETVEQLYEKAKAEKTLVFYAGGPPAPYEARIKQFQEKFPGIQVSVSGGFSNVLNQRIEKQMADGKLEVDFAFFQTVQDFVNWKKRGVLLPFKPDGFEQIIPNLRDPDGAYMAFAAITIAYAYNTEMVKPEGVPKSALDFLKPEFFGKLISVYPHDDDAALYLFHLIVKKYGWSWMDRYMANKPHFIQGHLPVARAIAEGKMAATLDATITTAGRQKRQGKPVEIAFSAEDETPVFTVTGGIFKDAPHRTQPNCSSPGTWRRNSRVASAPSPRGSTCRRRKASNRSLRTRSPTRFVSSSPTISWWRTCASGSRRTRDRR